MLYLELLDICTKKGELRRNVWKLYREKKNADHIEDKIRKLCTLENIVLKRLCAQLDDELEDDTIEL